MVPSNEVSGGKLLKCRASHGNLRVKFHSVCEEAAEAEGFRRMELVATLSGEELYRSCGNEAYEQIVDERGGQ